MQKALLLQAIEMLARSLQLDCGSLFEQPDRWEKPFFAAWIRRFSSLQQSDSSEEIVEELPPLLELLLASIDKTTYFLPESQAAGTVSFRLSPEPIFAHLDRAIFPKVPYAFFFMFSGQFLGWHVRFQDLARGGLRTVYLADAALRARSEKEAFVECYDLALTQNDKNKDIAEGGSKGLIFARSYLEHEEEEAALFGYQKLYVTELLSLVVESSGIVDHWGRPEYIYLGPDERMKNYAIEWISGYSHMVGYRPGFSFMSSSPTFGINHKAYGVTSRGLMAWLDSAMSHLFQKNILTDPFSISMTGGPDGDLASNIIKIVAQKYPKTGLFVAIKDKSGMAYDPEGLNILPLLDLAKQEQPISSYPTDQLSSKGSLLVVEEVSGAFRYTQRAGSAYAGDLKQAYDEGIYSIPSDVFIPAGGRPFSISEKNWGLCLLPSGSPAFSLIVEGANLFFTEPARLELEKRAVSVIRDSSANKGGVISSSFEVFCTLLLSQDEFAVHKEAIAQQILDRIAESCSREARLLFSGRASEPLSARSVRISEAMLEVRAAMHACLLDWDPRGAVSGRSEVLLELLSVYALPIMREKYRDRLRYNLPLVHQRAAVAAFLSSRYVYAHGDVLDDGARSLFLAAIDLPAMCDMAAQLLSQDVF